MDKLNKSILFILGFGFAILVFAFVVLGFDIITDSDDEFIVTDYGCFNLDGDILFIQQPEPYGVTYLVIYCFFDSGPVYRYFDTKEDAWTFYSIIRMSFIGGNNAKQSTNGNS